MKLFNEIRRQFLNWLIIYRQSGLPIIDLWVDDYRPAPHGWYHAKTYAEAVQAFERYQIGFMALDHDLGEKMTGYDFVKYIVERVEWFEAKWPVNRPFIITSNPIGRDNMTQLIDRYANYEKFKPYDFVARGE